MRGEEGTDVCKKTRVANLTLQGILTASPSPESAHGEKAFE